MRETAVQNAQETGIFGWILDLAGRRGILNH